MTRSINVLATVRSPGHDAFTLVPQGLVAKPIVLCLLRTFNTFQHSPGMLQEHLSCDLQATCVARES